MLVLAVNLFLLFGLLAGAVSLGTIILRRANLTFVSLLEQTLFAAGIGLAIYSYTVVSLAAVGGLYPAAAWILYGFSLAVVIIHLRQYPLRDLFAQRPTLNIGESLLVVLIALFGIFALIGASAPPTDWDSLMYHLEVPKRYIQAHGYVYLPNGYANFPQFIESLYALAMLLQDDILARQLNLSLGILATLAVYALARRFVDRSLAMLASLIFISSPLVIFVFVEPFIEAGLTFYSLLAVLAILTWRTNGQQRWLWLSAVLIGLSFAIKYYTIILGPILVWALLERAWRLERRPGREVIRLAIIAGLIALIFPLPWFVKNIIFVGDPIFPIISAWLGQWGQGLVRANWAWYGMGYSPVDYLLLPWRMTFNHQFGVPEPGFLFLLLLPFLFGLLGVPAAGRWLAGVILVWFIFWANSAGQSVRFFLPGLALLSAVITITIAYVPAWLARFRHLFVLGVMVIVIYQLIWPLVFGSWSLPFVSGQQSRHEYLTARLDIYPLADYANQHLPITAQIATVWEERGYYFDRPLVIGQSPDGAFLHQFITGDDPASLAEALLARGLTHLIINEALKDDLEFNLRDRHMYNVDTSFLLVYNPAFQSCYLRPLFNHQKITLYEISPASVCPN